jgi:hypothetical protein
LRLEVLRLEVLRLEVLRLEVLRLEVLRLEVLRLEVLGLARFRGVPCYLGNQNSQSTRWNFGTRVRLCLARGGIGRWLSRNPKERT